MTPKSLAEATGFHVARRNDILGFCSSLLKMSASNEEKFGFIWFYE